MDDIDDLLDEVEAKFCVPASSAKTKNRVPVNSPTKTTAGSLSSELLLLHLSKNESESINKYSNEKSTNSISIHRDEVDDLINDIDLHENLQLQPVSESCSSSSMVKASYTTKKCYPVFIGGSGTKCGHGSTFTQMSCDRLRCTACDFRVAHYDDYRWDQSVDYLFLRNNVPDFKKLSCKLKQEKGSRAYACQCRWRTTSSLVDLQSEKDLKWVCGKH